MFTITAEVGHRRRFVSAPDAHGNPRVDYADAEPVEVYGWGPGRNTTDSEPKLAGHERVVVDLIVYGPPKLATIGALDRIEVNGHTYDVVGEPEDYNHGPFGWEPGVAINLRRVEG